MPAKASTRSKKNTNLPTPPSLLQTIGPSFILLGLALGSGELLLWPYLAATWGLGLLWGGLLGITFQYFLNTETMRYTLAWGESVFVGFRKLSIFIPIWFIISTFIPWSLPGFSSATSQIITSLVPWLPEKAVAIALLLLTGLILSMGKTLNKTMEIFQKSVIFIGLPLIIYLVWQLTTSQDWIDLAWGLVGRGDGYWFVPGGVALASFLGAFAYSGGGGNLNLAQSYYIKEQGFGMGAYAGKISSILFSKEPQTMQLEGRQFSLTKANMKKWHAWWRLVNWEHFLVFWGVGLFLIVSLSVLAKTTVYGQADSSGLSFLYQEATAITQQTRPIFGVAFLLVAALMLFSTQVGVLESASRIISENILLLFYKKGKAVQASLWFYAALWAQIALGIVVYAIGFQEPRFLLTLGAALNAAAMMVAFGLVLVLNMARLERPLQPRHYRKAIMAIAFVAFLGFVWITVQDAL